MGDRVIVIVIALMVAVSLGWLYHVSERQTADNRHAIRAACVSGNANRRVERHVLVVLRDHPTIFLTPAELTKREHTYNTLIKSIVLERCP